VTGDINVTTGNLNLTGVNSGIEIGSKSASNTPIVDFHSSGNNIDYDVRIAANGGSASVGQGALTVTAGGGTNFSGGVSATGATVTQANDAILALEDTSALTTSYRLKRIFSSKNVDGGNSFLFRQTRPSDGAILDYGLGGASGTILTTGNSIQMRVNSGQLEFWNGTGWVSVAGFGKTSRSQVSMNAGATGTILSVTGAGVLNALYITGATNPTGAAQLEIVVDGVSYSTTTVFWNGPSGGVLTGPGQFSANSANDWAGQCDIAFKSSLLVRYNTNTLSITTTVNSSYTTP
jgi:hypothetical protein